MLGSFTGCSHTWKLPMILLSYMTSQPLTSRSHLVLCDTLDCPSIVRLIIRWLRWEMVLSFVTSFDIKVRYWLFFCIWGTCPLSPSQAMSAIPHSVWCMLHSFRWRRRYSYTLSRAKITVTNIYQFPPHKRLLLCPTLYYSSLLVFFILQTKVKIGFPVHIART